MAQVPSDVHARAWKKLFDDFLRGHAQQSGGVFVPFDIEVDYRRYVDGKPRQDGIISFRYQPAHVRAVS